MSLSFRTNGNFIDFVNTDATSLNVETVIMKLHNTSRCIDWSLPEDTTKISFTIDEVKYSNIPITEIDFDGTVMNSQDDFETGITGMFTGLAGGGGSGGGVESVTYQNNAMSSPVKAFVFKDESNNIYRVYEPIRNNDVSRKTFAYADSIDKFAFDNVNLFNNNLSDAKLIGLASDVKIQGSKLEKIVIDGGNFTGLEFIDYKHEGLYGEGEEDNEISISGNGCKFKKSTVGTGTFFNQCGANTTIEDVTIGPENFFYFEGFTTTLQYGFCNANSYYQSFFNGGGLYDFKIGSSCEVYFGSETFQNIFLAESVKLGDDGNSFHQISGFVAGSFNAIKPINDDLIVLTNCQIGSGYRDDREFIVIKDHENCVLLGSLSTFDAEVPIDGLTTFDMETNLKFYGVITLTSANPTESLDGITGMQIGVITKFQPASGLTVTFNGSSGSGIFAMPTADFVANGTKSDFIEFEMTPAFLLRQVNAQKYL